MAQKKRRTDLRSIPRRDDAPKPGGRIEKKRRATRMRLLSAAYDEICKAGVSELRIKEITERADVGFGTFYNYFDSLYELEIAVLDCVIHDYGRRNVIATRKYSDTDPALVMPISMRLLIRDVTREPMWQWWARRPEQLAGRMRKGFGLFAKEDILNAIRLNIIDLSEDDVEMAWNQMIWLLVGGIHDIVVGVRPLKSEQFLIHSILRMIGADPDLAKRASSTRLPKYTEPDIDWSFEIDD